MNGYSYDTKDMIYALATPWGTSAIAVIRISGAGCIEALKEVFSRPEALAKCSSHTLVHGQLLNRQTSTPIDEVLLSIFKDGRGFTGEESVEISCHGSMAGVESIFKLLTSLHMRSAAPGEFTFRAFMHGKMDLTRAEAVMEIVSSQSELGHSLALERLEGHLFTLIEEIKQLVLHAMSVIEVQLDYAEDEISGNVDFPFDTVERARGRIETLLATYAVGKLYGEGAKVVLAGSTNAGKSTLFNLLLREDRSIVSDVHGTTRDFIESKTVLDGIPVRIYDTAGLRDSDDMVEMEGIRRTRRLIDDADLILLLLDGTEHDSESAVRYGNLMDDTRCIVVWNKTDLATNPPLEGSFPLSAKRGEGFARLRDEMVSRLRKDARRPGVQDVVIESARQRDELIRAKSALTEAVLLANQEVPLDIVAVELGEALEALGSLTGEVASSDILEKIFSGFCVGK
ncbi:tRNA uridine-5-carboxymethylaminomethyl(34) synthesis GTPase MnmE [Pleomorphochaeta sp. DL1XJH-081]|uniref:tRNA uridine-5-carboxymethylaminomethyl(34) synthesis GTPase MnmE n=1 Tax=Pleomorphochaeta sp. DL1XJH-081 TaxID=3409690 RepID=UPI003BB669A5